MAVFIALASGILNVLAVQYPDQFDAATLLLFPGMILAVIVSGSVHDYQLAVVAPGNAIFYFGIVCLVWGDWEHRAARNRL